MTQSIDGDLDHGLRWFVMKRWLWFIAAICISTGVYYTIRYGLRPKPIPVMNPTEFTELEQIGVVTYKRLHSEVRAERLVLLGSSGVDADFRIWSGFLRAAVADKEKIVYFARAGMEAVPAAAEWETISFDDAAITSGEFFSKVKEHMKAGQLIVVHGLTKETSHLVEGSLVRQLESLVQHPVLSMSSLRFAIKPEEREGLQCLTASEDPSGERRLGCATQRVARLFQRKALDPSKIWAVIERHGLKEYLVFIHTP